MTAITPTIRVALYDILGKECAESILSEMGFEWAIVTAKAMLIGKDAEVTPLQLAFLEWVRDDYPNIEIVR